MTARYSTVPTPEPTGGGSGVISALLGLRCVRPPSQASPLGRPRIGWGAEGLIIEQAAAEAVGLLPTLGQQRCDYRVHLVDQPSPIVG
jgi:hypothetical protein